MIMLFRVNEKTILLFEVNENMILLFSRLWTRFCYRALKEQRYPDVVSRYRFFG